MTRKTGGQEHQEEQESKIGRINIVPIPDESFYTFFDRVAGENSMGRGALAATLLKNIYDIATGKKDLQGTLLYTLIYKSIPTATAPASTPAKEKEEPKKPEGGKGGGKSTPTSTDLGGMSNKLKGFPI